MLRDIEDLIREHKPIKMWCGGCHNTTSQKYVPMKEEEKKYEDCETYHCGSCHTIRYYEINPENI